MNTANLSPDAARELLAAADTGREKGESLAARAWVAAAMSVFIGLLMGAFLLASIYLFPTATGPQAALISGGYLAGILLAVLTYNLGRRVTPTGWIDRYERGLAISCVVFFVSLALSFLIDERSAVLWISLAVATVLPVSYFGTKR